MNEYNRYLKRKQRDRRQMAFCTLLLIALLCMFASVYAKAQTSAYNIQIPRYTTFLSFGNDLINVDASEGLLDYSAPRFEIGFRKYYMMDPFTHFTVASSIGFASGWSHRSPDKSFLMAVQAGIMAEQSVTVSAKAYRYWTFREWGVAVNIGMNPMDWFDNRRFIIEAYLEGGLIAKTGYVSGGIIIPINLDRK